MRLGRIEIDYWSGRINREWGFSKTHWKGWSWWLNLGNLTICWRRVND